MNVLYITNIPSPYRVDFFNELGKYCNLTVAFERVSARDRDRKWKPDGFAAFGAVFLKGTPLGTDASLSLQVIPIIKRGYHIIVLGGYSSPTYAIAMEYMKARGIPFILNADGGFIKQDKKPVYWLKRHLIGLPSAWLSTGAQTDLYLEHYGASARRIYRYPFTSVKEKECFLPSGEEKADKKRQLHMKEEVIVITVGQFIYRKGCDLLIRCSRKLRPNMGIYIIGGEPGEEYRRLLAEEGTGNIHFEGFKNREELRDYYIAADIFVFPTREDIWGLVLNEAMAHGLPCVASQQAIASREMIEPGINGYLVNPEELDEMSGRLNQLADSEEERIKLGENACRKAKEHTIEKMALRHMEIFRELAQ